MFKYIFKRIFYVFITLIVLLTLLFFLMQLIPGYPIEKGIHETEDAYMQRLSQLGLLDDPITQYFSFWNKLFTNGEFGVIFENGGNVINRFIEPVGYTLLFAIPSFIISAILGIFFGSIAAFYRGKWQDTLINTFSVIFVAIPSFVLALYLIKLAGLIGLPTNIVVPGSDGFSTNKMFLSLIIPVTSMVISSISPTIYFTRNELVEIFKQEYIKTALSKGMNFRSVVFKHAFRNAAIPVLYSLLPSLLLIFSGSIIIERFFNVPGTAALVIDAVQTNEYYIVMFSAIFYSSIYFLIQIFFDILSTIIDPRIKLVQKSNISYIDQFKSYYLRRKKYDIDENNGNIFPVKEIKNINIERRKISNNFKLDFSKPKILDSDFKKFDKSLFKRIDNELIDRNEILGKPNNQLVDIFKRFISNKVALFFSILLSIIILVSIFYPIFAPSVNTPINPELKDVINFLPPRFPIFGINGYIYNEIMTVQKFEQWQLVEGAIIKSEVIGQGLVKVSYNPYALPELQNYYPLFGTGPQGRDWTNVLWISVSNSLFMALVVAIISTLIGSIYGAIAGFNAGKPLDTFMMRVVELISGVPTIVWILVITLAFSGGSLSMLTIAGALIFTSWIWPAMTARIFVLKYKDSDFIQASKTLGANKSRLIFSHLLPNVSGKLMVRFVNQIPRIIFFETSLVFLGLKAPTDASLGTMIETARQTSHFHLLLAPTLIIVLITLSSQIIANAFNDSLDPRIIGR